MSRGNASGPTSPRRARSKPRSIPSPQPLKPRPRLLVVLSIIFALWVAGLLAMYFKTVYPYRHDSTAQRSGDG